VSRQKALIFQTKDIAASGGFPHQTAYPSSKDFGWMVFLGVEPRRVSVALAAGLRQLGGGITSAEGLRDGEAGRAPFELCLAFALQLRKSTENLSQGGRVTTGLLVVPTWLSFEGQPRLACWTLVHLGYPGDLSQPSVGTSAYRVAVLRGSPHQQTSSRNSRSVL
jgi:hypothetical protein